MNNQTLDQYSCYSELTHPQQFEPQLVNLPDSVADIVNLVQHNLVHAYWLDKYQINQPFQSKFTEMQARSISEMLTILEARSGTSLLENKAPDQRLVGVCRDFSIMACMLLQTQGIAARLRCGFATYLGLREYEDHWVCEYWHQQQQRWVMVDAQLDQVHKEILDIDFDPLDVPHNRFIYAGSAWQMCRANLAESSSFGIFNFTGWPIIKGNLIRDVFALNQIELLAWDCGWGILPSYLVDIADDKEWLLLDELANISHGSDFSKAQQACDKQAAIALPSDWRWSQAPSIAELLRHYQ
ncbi:transglutaminase domain-containing protein [Agarivorans sp. MS3-6]